MFKIADELSELMEAIRSLNKARLNCAYDWDYFLRSEIEDVRAAEEKFLDAVRKHTGAQP